jgi:hypothetical protein
MVMTHLDSTAYMAVKAWLNGKNTLEIAELYYGGRQDEAMIYNNLPRWRREFEEK